MPMATMAFARQFIAHTLLSATSTRYATCLSSLFTLVVAWFVYGSYVHDLAQSGSWGCEMSWMTPSYIPIPWPEGPSSKYRIYLYREQGWDVEEQVGSHDSFR